MIRGCNTKVVNVLFQTTNRLYICIQNTGRSLYIKGQNIVGLLRSIYIICVFGRSFEKGNIISINAQFPRI